ncbi:MAG: sigma-70 family RNA polymerase sigma factor [Acidobacteria bacterium]|nr:sigma-70 family RNA polymerase sigma factor [Acidobacteriota bacterium]
MLRRSRDTTSIRRAPGHARPRRAAAYGWEAPGHDKDLTARPERDTSDAGLLRAVARGDEAALASVYDRYAPILLGLVMRILHSRGEAEDVLQEVFLQVWRRAGDFDEGRGRPFTWLVTLARSRAIDRLRALDSRSRAALASQREPTEEVSDAGADAFRSEQGEIVRAALSQLSEEQRTALLLAYHEGLTQSEIAERLKQPLGTVKTRTRAGLMKMRELLRDKFEGADALF